MIKPVTLPPGGRGLRPDRLPTGISRRRRRRSEWCRSPAMAASDAAVPDGDDHVDLEAEPVPPRTSADESGSAVRPAILDSDVPARRPSRALRSPCANAATRSRACRISCGTAIEHTDPPVPRRLLRPRRERPRRRAPPSSVMNSRRCSGRDVRFMARPPPRSVRAAFPHTAPASGV